MQSLPEFISLLQSSDAVPHRITLRAIRQSEGADFGWVMTPVIVAANPDGLCIERHGTAVRAYRGEADVFRRSEKGCWVFRPDELPTYYRESSFAAFGGGAPFLSSGDSLNFPTTFMEVTQGSLLGRNTWDAHFSMPEATLRIDQETGVLLAITNNEFEVEASSFEVLTAIPDTSWTGEAIDFAPPASPEVTETPQELPPLRDDLRVWLTSDILESAIFPFTVGDWTRQSLELIPENRYTEPEKLATHRVTALPARYSHNRWLGYAAGEGWTAELSSTEPLAGDTEIRGYVAIDRDRPGPTASLLYIKRLFVQERSFGSDFITWREVDTTTGYRPQAPNASVECIVLDVDTRGPDRPAPARDLATSDAAIIDGQLWLLDADLPIAHGFDIRTGAQTKRTTIPVPVGTRLRFAAGQLSDGNTAFSLGDKFASKQSMPESQPMPQAPQDWSIMNEFRDGLVGLWNASDMIASVGKVDANGRIEVSPLRVLERLIDNAMRWGDGYAVSLGWGSGYLLDAELAVVKEINDGRGVPVPLGTIAGYESEDRIEYLDPATEEPMCTLPVAEFRTRPVAATPDLVAHLIDGRTLHVWQRGKQWTVELNRT
ncbi:hypothetical protein WG915_03965 [Corynebacterium sp. H128]|uniref:hypothetical protein n=1 Tax=Corynebacterium sp. H128 TaxID=3133427 RepID=UPI0030B2B6B9